MLVFGSAGTVRRSDETVAEFVPAGKVEEIFGPGSTRRKACVENSCSREGDRGRRDSKRLGGR